MGTALNAKWSLDSLLGVGGMGAVFAARHRNGTRAAVKLLHAEFAREKRDPRAIPARRQDREQRRSSRAGPRHRRRRQRSWRAVPRHGSARGRHAQRAPSSDRRQGPARGDAADLRDRPRPPREVSPGRHRPSRHQAREHLHHQRRRGEGPRLRRRAHARGRVRHRSHAHGDGDRNAFVHRARAGARSRLAGRRSVRHLLGRRMHVCCTYR